MRWVKISGVMRHRGRTVLRLVVPFSFLVIYKTSFPSIKQWHKTAVSCKLLHNEKKEYDSSIANLKALVDYTTFFTRESRTNVLSSQRFSRHKVHSVVLGKLAFKR